MHAVDSLGCCVEKRYHHDHCCMVRNGHHDCYHPDYHIGHETVTQHHDIVGYNHPDVMMGNWQFGVDGRGGGDWRRRVVGPGMWMAVASKWTPLYPPHYASHHHDPPGASFRYGSSLVWSGCGRKGRLGGIGLIRYCVWWR